MSNDYQQLALSLEASPVKIFRLLASVKDFLEADPGSGGSSIELLSNLARIGLLSRTFPVYYPVMEGKILRSSEDRWYNSGMLSAGGCLTLNTSESPKEGVECSLLQVLETDAAERYYLTPRAARGILRRAEKRGKTLPERLIKNLRLLTGEANGVKRAS